MPILYRKFGKKSSVLQKSKQRDRPAREKTDAGTDPARDPASKHGDRPARSKLIPLLIIFITSLLVLSPAHQNGSSVKRGNVRKQRRVEIRMQLAARSGRVR